MTPGKGSKYREFYDLSGRITCMLVIKSAHSGRIEGSTGNIIVSIDE